MDRRELVNSLSSVLDRRRPCTELQQPVLEVHVAPALLDYVQALVAHTRSAAGSTVGLSPRAAIGLLRAARAWALIAGRSAVIPEHVQAVFPAVVEHRIEQRDSGAGGGAVGCSRPFRCLERATPAGSAAAPPSARLRAWAARRHGADALPMTINRRRIYILPTRFGLMLAALLAAMLIAALNYNSNLGLAFAFFMVVARAGRHASLSPQSIRA